MIHIPFSKLSGSGNDFIIIDNREKIVDQAVSWISSDDLSEKDEDGEVLVKYDMRDFIKTICTRRKSVGADGVILIENDPKEQCDFAWRFYNSDSSIPAICGNGGRCAARFAFERGIADRKMSFRTLAGVINAEITGEKEVKLQLTPPAGYLPSVELEIEGVTYDMKFIDTGVPHVVVEVDIADDVDVENLGPNIRFHEHFAPEGTNVNFVQVSGPDSLVIRTYERGVEAETLACGTGSVAAAVTMAMAGRVSPPVRVITRSKEILTVHFSGGSEIPKEVYFEGAVSWICDGTLLPEAIL